MSSAEAELLEITRELAPRERRELLQFGRTLRARRKPAPRRRARRAGPDDAKWKRLLADPRPRPKLRAMLERARADLRAGKHFPELRLEDL